MLLFYNIESHIVIIVFNFVFHVTKIRARRQVAKSNVSFI
jgi:hypothetical protein